MRIGGRCPKGKFCYKSSCHGKGIALIICIALLIIIFIQMKSFSLLKVFLFDYLPDLMFELSEPPMRDCYDIQNSLSDVLECQKAASELGIIFDYEISSDSFPKGCSSGYNNV